MSQQRVVHGIPRLHVEAVAHTPGSVRSVAHGIHCCSRRAFAGFTEVV